MGCITCILQAVLALSILVLVGFKLWVKWNTKWARCYKCLIGKTVVITGANTGIGFETAKDFAMRGARVVMACRNAKKAERAKHQIVELTGNENIVIKTLDLASFKSVRSFCKDINETEERIDILVNNAGILSNGMEVTEDGIHFVIQSNHLGPFLLTNLLIDKLKKAAPSRIVLVSSLGAKSGKINPDTMKNYPSDKASTSADFTLYQNSKQANILFGRVLAQRLRGSGVSVFSLHPGAINTDISNQMTIIKMLKPIIRWVFMTPEEGAQTTVYCSLADHIERESGQFFSECQVRNFYQSCEDMKLAERLWVKSEELTKLEDHEKLSKKTN